MAVIVSDADVSSSPLVGALGHGGQEVRKLGFFRFKFGGFGFRKVR
jgi:hypothetical protein